MLLNYLFVLFKLVIDFNNGKEGLKGREAYNL